MATMANIKCDNCGKQFTRRACEARRSKRHFCSKECMGTAYAKEGIENRKNNAECKYCKRPLYRPPCRKMAKNFCDMACYRKWTDSKNHVRHFCEYCGKVFYANSASLKKCCSHECRVAYRNGQYLLGAYETVKRKEYICDGCGVTFFGARGYRSKTKWCSSTCFHSHYKLKNTPAWKGGWYINSEGIVYIAIGHKKKIQYRRRPWVSAELYLGYYLPKRRFPSLRMITINGNDRDVNPGNLYLCESQSEMAKMCNGSIPWPKRSNLDSIKTHGLYIDNESDWRLSLEISEEYVRDSLIGVAP